MIDDMRNSGKLLHPDHVEPDLWIASQPLMDLFWDIHGWRKSTGMGPARIDLSDIEYYCRHYGRVISYVEMLAVRRIDDQYMANYTPLKSE